MCSTDALSSFVFTVREVTKGFNPVYPITGLSGINICHQSGRDVAETRNAGCTEYMNSCTTDDGQLFMPLEFSADYTIIFNSCRMVMEINYTPSLSSYCTVLLKCYYRVFNIDAISCSGLPTCAKYLTNVLLHTYVFTLRMCD